MQNSAEIYDELHSALREGRTADADALTQLLHESAPASRESLTLKVAAFIESGQYLDALHCANSLEGESFPELKAISLYFLKDPLWEGIATSLEDDDHPCVRNAMRTLLDKALSEA
ncbi:MAG TPA: HrpB1 family type III secretion system apparatus protein [Trinickia sp.]|jgi:hypothetical protein|nr:HrpB1 family type III secretion system apparatus protein [Trinickia sp.]